MYNFETMTMVMEGMELLYNLVTELADGIKALPGCAGTESLKQLALSSSEISNSVYHAIKRMVNDTASDDDCDVCDYCEGCNGCCECCGLDIYEDNAPSKSELDELLDTIASFISSGKPVTLTANIQINTESEDK